MLDMLS
jgi:hypothetical protein